MNERRRTISIGNRKIVGRAGRALSKTSREEEDVSLVQMLESNDRLQDEDRAKEKYHHASALVSGCPRAQALVKLGLSDLRRPIRSADRLVWAIGRAVEHHIRISLIQKIGLEKVYGKWTCLCGSKQHTGFGVAGKQCNQCQHEVNVYGEPDFLDEDYLISGHPDFLYQIGGKLRVVEIKSKKKELFDALQSAEADHIGQAGTYRKMGEVMALPMDNRFTVLYGCKDYSFKGSVYKEYHYSSDMPQVEIAVNNVWSNASSINSATAKALPKKLSACGSVNSARAKQCFACGPCFSRQ